MQHTFQLTPLSVKSRNYSWETGSWDGDPYDRYAVVYNDKIVAIFDSRHWADRFIEQNIKMGFEIMLVDE